MQDAGKHAGRGQAYRTQARLQDADKHTGRGQAYRTHTRGVPTMDGVGLVRACVA